jgi:hypothetical protein
MLSNNVLSQKMRLLCRMKRVIAIEASSDNKNIQWTLSMTLDPWFWGPQIGKH